MRASAFCFYITILLFKESHTQRGSLSFSEQPADSVVPSGASTKFRCRVDDEDGDHGGGGPLLVTWLKDGRTLRRDRRVRFSNDGTTVYLKGVRKGDDEGFYQCQVESAGQQIRSRRARLIVVDRREKPKITHRPTYTEVTRGETVRLTCGSTGYPPPTFSWYKDGGRLSEAHDRYEIDQATGTLVIVNAQLDDTAHFRCSASNYLGRAGSAARVKVNPDVPEAPPVITSSPRDARTHVDSIVEFTCVASGNPYPDLTWWNNNRIVNTDGRVTVSNGGQYLRITDLEIYDSGRYVCRATNRLGSVEAEAALEVVGDDDDYDDEGDEEQQPAGPHHPVAGASTSPVAAVANSDLEFLTRPHDMVAPAGATVQLPCRATGTPRPSITWTRDGVAVESTPTAPRKHHLSRSGSLVVFNVGAADEGEYECAADNGRDRITASARFSIRAPAAPPTPPRPRAPPPPRPSSPTPTTSIFGRVIGDPSSVSYDPGVPSPGDEFVVVSLEEAAREVDEAINKTVEALFSKKANTSTPAELLRLFRYPAHSQRGVARAAEVFHRTLELVADRVKAAKVNAGDEFDYRDLVSPSNLEVIANLSGCEAHRAAREVNCTQDMCFHLKYRSLDGTCNNFASPLWGSSLTAFRRLLPAQYEDGFNSPVGWDPSRAYSGFPKPGARLVSNLLISAGSVTDDPVLSHMSMQWGQFLDHDLDHSMEAVSRQTFETGVTCGAVGCRNEQPCFPIPIPADDPRVASGRCMEFTRSSAACGSGATSVFFDRVQPREQVNQLTAFLDASQVYGSTADAAVGLRNLTNDYGRLREGPKMGHLKPFLPFNRGDPIDCRRDPTASNIGCFLAGDTRANEHVALLAMHTVWFREHNRLVTELRQLNPHWDGDKLYHEARKIVGAEMQVITYSHWLPSILGPDGAAMLGPYSGYSPSTDPTVSNVFSSSAFRFGHTMVNPVLRRLDSNFAVIPEGDLPLNRAFFAPWRLVEEGGVDPILRGLFATPAKKHLPSQVMNTELTEKLFEAAHAIALDLGALNVQRGRDHGLPPYAEWRRKCADLFGAEAGNRSAEVNSWSDFAADISDAAVRQRLAAVYGHPMNVDVWVGGLLETPVEGGRVGWTVRCLLVEQFRRIRDGDRFWYENPSTFTPAQLSQLRQATLGRILCDNGDDIDKVTKDVFRKPDKEEELVPCSDVPKVSLHPWFECDESDAHTTSPFLHLRPPSSSAFISGVGGGGSTARRTKREDDDRSLELEEELLSLRMEMEELKKKMTESQSDEN